MCGWSLWTRLTCCELAKLSRRVGVSSPVLRAWEARYGLLNPARSPGGFRLYSDSDERRVRRMKLHLAEGLSAAEAARAAIAEAHPPPPTDVAGRIGMGNRD